MAKEAIEHILDERRHPILVMCKCVRRGSAAASDALGGWAVVLMALVDVRRTGVHFSGTIIGCLRRLQNWSLTATIDKVQQVVACMPPSVLRCSHRRGLHSRVPRLYHQYRNLASSIKTRFENEQFIELFDVDLVTLPQQLPDWFVHNQKLMVRTHSCCRSR